MREILPVAAAEPAARVRPAIWSPEPARIKHLDPHLVSLVDPACYEAEQYRALRARLDALRESERVQVLAVSSAAAGEGKTTTAINLAGALAQAAETRVLLMDGDLRRPGVGKQIGLEEAGCPGLTEAIHDPRRTLDTLVQRRFAPHLEVLTAGRPSPSPYETLEAPRFGELIAEARRRYDTIVIDTPPLLPVPDCRLIMRWVDGLILVVAANRTPGPVLEECLNLLEPGKILGIVFNGESRPVSGYHEYARAYRESWKAASRNSAG